MSEAKGTVNLDDTPHDPNRLIAFAGFFKRYMSVSALLTAALPIPVTALQLIPTFATQTRILSVYTSLFCFLILGFIFYRRHDLARLMFSEFTYENRPTRAAVVFVERLPGLLIVLSLLSLIGYHFLLDAIVPRDANSLVRQQYLQTFPPFSPIYSTYLIIMYLGLFVFAESAFVLMAVKEYLQDVLHLSDVEVIHGQRMYRAETDKNSAA
jgi:hypothetical protein